MNNSIKLIFSGDFVPNLGKVFSESVFSDELIKLLGQNDVHITNLESPLTLSENKIKKSGPHLKAEPKNIKLLKSAGVNIACLANNHIYDFGEEGINDTIEICKENGIETLGIVNRTDGNPHCLIKEIKGKKIGFLNYCEHEFSVREHGLLGACGFSPIDAYYDICKLKQQADYIIVIYHGGNEYYPLPNPEMKKSFRYLAELGADAVIGHHTHVYSGYEIYNCKPLVYSLGNFFFSYPGEPEEWNFGLICTLNISSEITVDLHPIIQCRDKVETKMAGETVKQKMLSNISQLSEWIQNEESLIISWDAFCETKRVAYIKQFPCFSSLLKIALKIGIPLKYLLPESRVIGYENMLRCQAHFEIIKYILKKRGN
ncbi:MAG: CapA family protein [Bacteroidota bacterium]